MTDEKSFRERVEEIRKQRESRQTTSTGKADSELDEKTFHERVEEIRKRRERSGASSPKRSDGETIAEILSEIAGEISKAQENISGELTGKTSEESGEKSFRERIQELRSQSSDLQPRQPDFPELSTQMEMDWDTLSANRIVIETDEERLTFFDEDVSRLESLGVQSYQISGQPSERTSLSEPASQENDTNSSNSGHTRVFSETPDTPSQRGPEDESGPTTDIQYCPRCGENLSTFSNPAYCPHCGHNF